MDIDILNGENYTMHKTVLKLVIYYGSHFPSNISIDFGLVTKLKENCVLLVYNTHHRQADAGLHTSFKFTSGISERPQVSMSSSIRQVNYHRETCGDSVLALGLTASAGCHSCHLFQ